MLFLSKDPSLAIFVMVFVIVLTKLACERSSSLLAFWKQSQRNLVPLRTLRSPRGMRHDETRTLHPPVIQTTH